MVEPLHTVAYTAAFLAQAKADGMTEAEMEAMERMLAAHPEAGEMIVGSGGYRVVTFFAHAGLPVYLVAMLSKGGRANFSAAEVAVMATMAKRIVAAGAMGRLGDRD
jgi:hypothetical protein